MTGVAELIRAVAALMWPILAFCAVWLFRPDIRELLARVRKGKVLGSEFEFDPRGAALSAENKADAALGLLGGSKPGLRSALPAPKDDLRALATEYDQIRSGAAPESGNSPAVNEIVGRMIRAAAVTEEFDLESAITSPSAGTRLAAYAYILEHPAPKHLSSLVRALAESEPTGNGQYWAIQALGRVFPLLPGDDRRLADARLRQVLANYPPSSDRRYALRKLLGPLQLDLRKGTDDWHA